MGYGLAAIFKKKVTSWRYLTTFMDKIIWCLGFASKINAGEDKWAYGGNKLDCG